MFGVFQKASRRFWQSFFDDVIPTIQLGVENIIRNPVRNGPKGTNREEAKKKSACIDNYLLLSTPEACAVEFVRKYLRASRGMWVDILEYDCPMHYLPEDLQFKEVRCELFPRKIVPEYPPREKYDNEVSYRLACRGVTWETAHEDIENQRSRGKKGWKFVIKGVRYFDRSKKKPSFFKEDAPKCVKALAKNLNNRTNPLWGMAAKYVNPEYSEFDPYLYKIVQIRSVR